MTPLEQQLHHDTRSHLSRKRAITLRPADDEDVRFLRENRNDPHVRATRHAYRPTGEDGANGLLGGTVGANDDSIGLLVCADGEWCDTVRYGLLADEWSSEPLN